MKKKILLKLLTVASLSMLLAGCDDANVYGSVSVGSSWGGYPSSYYGGYGRYPSSRVTIGVSGRIR